MIIIDVIKEKNLESALKKYKYKVQKTKQTEKLSLKGKDGLTKDFKAIKILSDDGDSVLAIELNKIGTGSKPMRINKSELDIYTFE